MPASQLFRKNAKSHLENFEIRRNIYKSQINAFRSMVSEELIGIEIGVSAGRIIRNACLEVGAEPCTEMRTLGLEGIREDYVGCATTLPFWNGTFDYAVIPATISFVDEIESVFAESHRILKDEGEIMVGFIDANTEAGTNYLMNRFNRDFYLDAFLYSSDQVIELLEKTGFKSVEVYQTVFGNVEEISDVQEPQEGYGDGAFVIIKAKK